MSGFFGRPIDSAWSGQEELRLNPIWFQPERMFADIWAIAPASFETPWWPKGGGFMGSPNVDVFILEAAWWGEYDQASGAASRYAFAGYTRDALGTIVPGVTVKAFRTSDDSLQGTAVSDTLGFFFINTLLYPDPHYLVAHKTASPDVDGVSINTLIGI